MEAAIRQVGTYQERPKGTVRLNLSRAAATMGTLPRLGDFLATYPDGRLDLVIDDDLTDVVARGFDAGIRIDDQVSRDMVAVRVTPDFRMAVVGAPAYFEGRSSPQRPEELSKHRCLTYRWGDSGALFAWRFHGPDGPLVVDVDSVLTVNDTDLLRVAALQGAGLAFLAETAVAPHLAGGDLIRVLANWCAPIAGLHLYYASRSQMCAPEADIEPAGAVPPLSTPSGPSRPPLRMSVLEEGADLAAAATSSN
ncbi:LysR substrate-binding domain-containing protein [Methylorubrum rhodesianum]|uniref:LysR substrate-binding domain-containing protein n=1 Tax=Methylorubrum rhodesianum TaxID=29427 RepID=UPI003CFC4252